MNAGTSMRVRMGEIQGGPEKVGLEAEKEADCVAVASLRRGGGLIAPGRVTPSREHPKESQNILWPFTSTVDKRSPRKAEKVWMVAAVRRMILKEGHRF